MTNPSSTTITKIGINQRAKLAATRAAVGQLVEQEEGEEYLVAVAGANNTTVQGRHGVTVSTNPRHGVPANTIQHHHRGTRRRSVTLTGEEPPSLNPS
jgi:hypothetical protein